MNIFEEKLHSEIENNSIKFIDLLRNSDISSKLRKHYNWHTSINLYKRA